MAVEEAGGEVGDEDVPAVAFEEGGVADAVAGVAGEGLGRGGVGVGVGGVVPQERVQGSGFRVQVEGLRLGIADFGLRIADCGEGGEEVEGVDGEEGQVEGSFGFLARGAEEGVAVEEEGAGGAFGSPVGARVQGSGFGVQVGMGVAVEGGGVVGVAEVVVVFPFVPDVVGGWGREVEAPVARVQGSG